MALINSVPSSLFTTLPLANCIPLSVASVIKSLFLYDLMLPCQSETVYPSSPTCFSIIILLLSFSLSPISLGYLSNLPLVPTNFPLCIPNPIMSACPDCIT